ncbi:MAG: aminodeoxychorismate/anthranilate synthase component II [Cyclobacteriaceae bacterium]
MIYDNFDSFTYNLVDYFARLGVECRVLRNDVSLEKVTEEKYEALVLSPGPQTPEKAGGLMKVFSYYADRVPVLGICLGHQAIGVHYGAGLKKAIRPMHGKVSQMQCESHYLWQGITNPSSVVRYHSLILDDLPDSLEAIARTAEGEIMAIAHKELPVCGLQFHPEAVLTENGLDMLYNWVARFGLTSEIAAPAQNQI